MSFRVSHKSLNGGINGLPGTGITSFRRPRIAIYQEEPREQRSRGIGFSIFPELTRGHADFKLGIYIWDFVHRNAG
jgi:hypothetical protein